VIKNTSIITTLLFLLLQTAFTQNQQGISSFPRLSPDPKALEYYNLSRQNSSLTWNDLAEIGLWASGDASLANLGRIRAAVEALNSSGELPSTARGKAEFILTYMHRNILRSYSIYQTRVDTIFANGTFNCVSSAVLYTIFCASAGIDTSAVITRDHSFVIVHIDGENIDVETTNRLGFDPGNRREFHDQFGRSTGFTYIPAQNYRDRQTISRIELISLILNNRISDLERANRFADAVPLAIDRAALLAGDPERLNYNSNPQESLFEDPARTLMDRLFNLGAFLLRSNREEDCIRWAANASQVYPSQQRWQDFLMAAVNNRCARFLRENKVTDARNFLESMREILSRENYLQLDTVVLEAELLTAAGRISSAAEGDSVIADVEQQLANGRISQVRAREITIFAVQKTASVLASPPARDWRAAIQYLERAAARTVTNRDIEQALRTYRANLVADYHNRFAAEWNRRNYDEAARILNEALTEFPEERQLLRDKEIVDRQNAR
jgi:tetratricopeptide (TPR) repeat protein